MTPRWKQWRTEFKFIGRAGDRDVYCGRGVIIVVYGPGKSDYCWATHIDEYKHMPGYEQIAAMVALHG